MDNELFELCKEVYRRFPEWNFEDKFGCDAVHPNADVYHPRGHAPIYTSDYLLEKLPPRLDIVWYLTVGEAGGAWGAWYMHGISKQTHDKLQFIADTPLKALLKLVIALDDAGVKL